MIKVENLVKKFGEANILIGTSHFAPELSFGIPVVSALLFVALGSYSFSKIEI